MSLSSNVDLAICKSLNVLDISLGHDPSFRADPQISNTLEGLDGSAQLS
jgi:hypothetical protein